MPHSDEEYSQAQIIARASAGPSSGWALPLKAVQIELLDQNGDPGQVYDAASGQPVGPMVATGFLMREGAGEYYLYTCWHVVTGINPQAPAVPAQRLRRTTLRFSMQNNNERAPGLHAIGGLQTITLPLYDTSTMPWRSLWGQDEQSRPNADLAGVGLALPFWRDIVRIRVTPAIEPSLLQVLTPVDQWSNLVSPGDNLMIVGYPYGYSSMRDSPNAVAITRSVAATRLERERPMDILIDGGGAPGMSGSPVFYVYEGRIYLYGVYTGVLYPDGPRPDPERTTALGTVCSLGTALPFVRPDATQEQQQPPILA